MSIYQAHETFSLLFVQLCNVAQMMASNDGNNAKIRSLILFGYCMILFENLEYWWLYNIYYCLWTMKIPNNFRLALLQNAFFWTTYFQFYCTYNFHIVSQSKGPIGIYQIYVGVSKQIIILLTFCLRRDNFDNPARISTSISAIFLSYLFPHYMILFVNLEYLWLYDIYYCIRTMKMTK